LNVVIVVHDRVLPKRHIECCRGRSKHVRLLDVFVHLARHLARGAVNTAACCLTAPVLCVSTSIVEGQELLALKPALSNVGDLILNAWLILRSSYARQVDEQAAGIGVVQKRVV
jgi:hypothetical protein